MSFASHRMQGSPHAHAGAAVAPAAGSWVVSFAASSLGAAQGALSDALSSCGGSIAGFLPPLSFQILVPAGVDAPGCVAALAAVPGVEDIASLPHHLRVHGLEGEAPLRALSVALSSEGSGGGPAALELRVAALAREGICPSCTVLAADPADTSLLRSLATAAPRLARGVAVSVTAVVTSVGPACAASCAADAPAACGCVIPASYAAALAAALPDALWVTRFTAPRLTNVYQQAVTMSTAGGAGSAASEWGPCDYGSCSLLANLPLNALPQLYPAALGGGGPAVNASNVDVPFVPGAPCASACALPACGQGVATCAGLTPPLAAAGLTGAGQVVAVVDTGLDYLHPLYLDPNVPTTPSQAFTPIPLNPAHRKVLAYWSLVDAYDEFGGHGTHTAGSVAGFPASTTLPGDAAVLGAATGAAPDAHLVFVDIQCTTRGGCNSSIPAMGFVPDDGAIHTPAESRLMWFPIYETGARIVSNSWGTRGGYSASTYLVDETVFALDDLLLIWSAGNELLFQSLAAEAESKNSLTVAATAEGLASHLAKIRGDAALGLPSLLGGTSMRACPGTLYFGAVSGISCPPQPLTPVACANVAGAGFQLGPNPFFGGLFEGMHWRNKGTFDLALCCGCSARQLFDGLAELSGNDTTPVQNLVPLFESLYSAYSPADGSAKGPTFTDQRSKPDLAAPGVNILSGLASHTVYGAPAQPYGAFACPLGDTITPPATGPTFKFRPFEGKGAPRFELFVSDPPTSLGENRQVKAGLGLAGGVLTVTEPVLITTVTVPDLVVVASAGDSGGDVLLQLVQGSKISTMFVGVPSSGGTMFSLSTVGNEGGYEASAGAPVALTVFIQDRTIVNGTLYVSAPNASLACWGSLSSAANAFPVIVTTRRGGGTANTLIDSGTSMSTPHVAGLAALVRQYFTDGYFPTGSPVAADGRSPSAALMKAVLINSATDLYDDTLAAMDPTFTPQPLNVQRFRAGFGVVNLMRGLELASVGAATRDNSLLPRLLLPGTSLAPLAPLLPTQTAPPDGAKLKAVDPSVAHNATATYCIAVASPATWVSLTLVWTDPPGNPIAQFYLVNDLDLEVRIVGSGVLLRGNSLAGAAEQVVDTLNNVEKLYLPAGFLANATRSSSKALLEVTVRGSRVVLHGPQAFALVITGPSVELAPATSCSAGAPSPVVSPSLGASPSPPASPSRGASPSQKRSPAAAASGVLDAGAVVGIAIGSAAFGVLLTAALLLLLWQRGAAKAAAAAVTSDTAKAPPGAALDVREVERA